MPDNVPSSILKMQTLKDKATLPDLPAEWFRVISNILATAQVVMVVNQDFAEIKRTESGVGWQFRIPRTTGSGLPSNAGKSKYMVPTLSADNATETDNPNLWTVDWLRAHA